MHAGEQKKEIKGRMDLITVVSEQGRDQPRAGLAAFLGGNEEKYGITRI